MQDAERIPTNRLTTFVLNWGCGGGYEAMEALAGEVVSLRKPDNSSSEAAAEVAAKLLKSADAGHEGKSLWGPEDLTFVRANVELVL
jgi:hypothetical protein